MKSLDEIMSREGEAMPDREAPVAEIQDTPAPVEAPAVEEPEIEAPEAGQSGMVPVAALQAERAKGRKYTEELAETNRRLAEMEALLTRRQHQTPQPGPEQDREPPKAPEFWDDPDKAIEHRASQMLDPVRQSLMFNARLTAEAIHKSETVKEAEAAFNAAAANGALDPEIHRRINASPNPFHAAVQWHQNVKRHEALSKYGDDPEAAFEAEVQRRLAARTQQTPPATAQPLPGSLTTARNQGDRSSGYTSEPLPLSEIMKR